MKNHVILQLLGVATFYIFVEAITFPIPTTNYPIPTGAIFVSPNGNDANTGTAAAAPLKNPSTALSRVASGGTVVFRGGSYYNVELKSITKKVTLQAYPNEQPWIKGSVIVSGWTVDGVTWKHTGWTQQFCQTCYKSPEAIDPAYPYAGFPDQVFINSDPLKQVGSKAAVTSGTFYVDYTNSILYVGTDPNGKTVEASTQFKALQFENGSQGSIVRGLVFAQYAPYWNEGQLGAVISNTAQITFESCGFVQSAGTSLAIVQPDNVLKNSYIGYNGYRGVNGNKCDRLRIEDNTIEYNNLEHFSINNQVCSGYCTVAGIKIAHADDVVVKNNDFRSNIGTGLWFDLGCTDAIVVRNTFTNNQLHGAYYEVSSRAIIASNIFAKNSQFGLKIAGSDKVRVYNNDFVRNHKNLGVLDDDRAPDSFSANLGLTWNTANTEIRNNLFSNTGGSGVFYESNNQDVNSAQMVSLMDHNGWYRTSATAPTNLFYWCAPTCNYLGSHAQFVSAAQKDYVPPSIVIENTATNPFFVDETTGNYNLKSGSSAIGAGAPLPSDIATAIGVSTSPVNMGALEWRGKAGTVSSHLTFLATDDATIQQATPTVNYGSAVDLIADNDPRSDILLKYTVYAVGGRTVTQARLILKATDPGAAGAQVYKADHNNWSQSTVTWNSAPWVLTPALRTLPAVVNGTYYAVDVTGAVPGDGVYSFRIIQPSNEGIRFSSMETAAKPLLEVTMQ